MENGTEEFLICDRPGWKSNIIPLRILTVLLRSKRCSAVVPLRTGLIRTAKLHQCLIRYVYGVAILFILNKVLQDNYTFKHYYSVQLTPPYYVTIVLLPQAVE